MQQYDLQGVSHGCRSALVSVEAQPVSASSFLRRCVVAKIKELTIDKVKDAVQQNAGGLLVVVPPELDKLSEKEKEHIVELEQDLMEEETVLPVYFTYETKELLDLYDDISKSLNSNNAGSALEALMGSVTSNGFQLVVSGSVPKALNDFQIVNLQGKLVGYGIEDQLPTIVIVAHYDAFGIAPSLSFGSDSNGSGVVALLELSRLMSKLYVNSRSHARYNMLFLLTGAGKFNYQGTKRWLDDQIEGSESGQLSDVAYVMCLDSIGAGSDLYVHVSKPPKNGSAVESLIKSMETVAESSSRPVQLRTVHKKINLGEDYLAWEHERFSIRRLPAFTVSHLESHKVVRRNTILDTRETIDTGALSTNIRIIAESLARHIYNLSDADMPEVFTDGLKVEEGLVSAWMDYLSSRPRAAQLLNKDSSVIATLEQAMSKYLKDVRRHSFKADKRDPECVFYSGADYTMSAYSVKPAVFDLFLGIAIAAYLAVLYFFIQNFSELYSLVKRLNSDNGSSKKMQ
jgi:hypothetical protein